MCNDYIKLLISNLEQIEQIEQIEQKSITLESNNTPQLLTRNIYKETLFINDIKYNIFRYPGAFHQNDDTIRPPVYNILYRIIIPNKDITFIGGEMYIFAKFLKYMNSYFYSNSSKIINTTKLNNVKYNSIHLVNYKTKFLKIYTDYLIINISKSGIGNILCDNILNIGYKNIIIISCNDKSLFKDLLILCKSYEIKHKINIVTNYKVTVVNIIFKKN